MDKKKVLLIGDTRTILNTYSCLLREEGYHVVTANSGFRVLEELSQHSFDLFINDLAMNDRKWFTILGMIKILFPNTPIIVFANNRYEIIKIIVSLGDSFTLIERPCRHEAFISCIRSSLTMTK